MKKITNLRDLFVEQGRELYDSASQEERELPKIRQQVREPELQKLIDRQVKVAGENKKRIEEALGELKADPNGVKNTCCESMLKRTQNYIQSSANAEVKDAAIINSLQRINHNSISGYGALSAYAKELGQKKWGTSLNKSMEEERDIDKKLSELAENRVNRNSQLEPAE
jgi:ferritin-like metal-binding protein YciE